MAEPEKKTYELAGRKFFVLPPVARQEKWLWPLVKPIMMKAEASGPEIMDLLFEQGPRVCAILLIDEGKTQVQKCDDGQEPVNDLERWLAATCRSQDLAPVLRDFFGSGQFAALAVGMVSLLPDSLTTGSSKPSAS